MGRTSTETPAVRRSMRRYYLTFAPAVVLYVAGTMGLFIAEGRSTGFQLALAAIPIAGVLWMTAAIVGLYQRSDELMRTNMLRGAATGFAAGVPALAIAGLVFSFVDEPPGDGAVYAIWGPFMIAMVAWSVGWARAHHTDT